MWMFFLSGFINFCSASNLLWSFLCFSFFFNFGLKMAPLFISMATAEKFVLPIPICLDYVVPLDVDVTWNITVIICEVWSEFNIFCTLVTMETAAILIFYHALIAAKHYGGYSYKVSWSLMRGIHIFLNPPFLFPWQLQQRLSNRFWFVWLFSFH